MTRQRRTAQKLNKTFMLQETEVSLRFHAKNAELKAKVILDGVFENETKTLEFEYLYTVKKSAGSID